MSKLSRHQAILELVDSGPVPSQEELQRLLHKRGFDAGQATLSRDIRELGLVKTADGYSLPASGNGNGNGHTDLHCRRSRGWCANSLPASVLLKICW